MVEKCYIIKGVNFFECVNEMSEEIFDCCDILILIFFKVCVFI